MRGGKILKNELSRTIGKSVEYILVNFVSLKPIVELSNFQVTLEQY